MSILEQLPRTSFRTVTYDLYRNIHKAIRSELFAATAEASRIDPGDRTARAAFAGRFGGVVEVLLTHAEHEDGAIGPALEIHLPELASKIETDHQHLDGRIALLSEMTAEAVDGVRGNNRDAFHRIYLELASFTSEYLEHQDVEERVLMPALEDAVGVESVMAMHQAILATIPPDQMADSLALMLPALNIEDRAEMLGGMQANAPAEVFNGVWALACSVLAPVDQKALAGRLGIS